MFKDIDNAIEYTRKVSRLNKNRFWGEVIIYTHIDVDKKIGYSPAECAEEHEQLAEWLEELKAYREKELKHIHDILPPVSNCTLFNVEKLTEQLKEGE